MVVKDVFPIGSSPFLGNMLVLGCVYTLMSYNPFLDLLS